MGTEFISIKFIGQPYLVTNFVYSIGPYEVYVIIHNRVFVNLTFIIISYLSIYKLVANIVFQL